MTKKEPWHDDRWTPLLDFAYETYREEFGVTLILNASDTKALKTMLMQTKNLPEFSLEKLKIAWLLFTVSQDNFDRKQAHPLRYWASSINRFMAQKNGNGNLDAARAFVKGNLK